MTGVRHLRARPLSLGLRIVFVCLSCIAFCRAALALDPDSSFDRYRLDRWGVEEGLPQISVLSIAQDRLGYLWLGLQVGVARFDGSRFTVYDRRTTGVDTTFGRSALATADGSIWFGTPRGLLRFHEDAVSTLDAGGKPLSVLALAQGADGSVLAASESGMFAVAGSRLVAMPGLREPAYSLYRDGDAVWIGGVGALTRLRAKTSERIALPERTLKILHIARDGQTLWLGTPSGLRRFDPRSGSLEPVAAVGDASIESLRVDRAGNLWVGTIDRLFRRRPDGAWENVEPRDLFARPWIDAIFEDREGSLWLGTHYESLVRLRDSAISRIGERQGMVDPFVWSVLRAHDGHLLLGTNDGLVAIGADGVARPAIPGKALPQAQIYTLAQDPDGTLWIGTRGGLVLWRNGAFVPTPALGPLAGLQIDAVVRVGDDDHWLATHGGLYRFRHGVLQSIGPTGDVPAAGVRSVLPLSPDDVLIGTDAGVYRVQGERISMLPGTESIEQTPVMRLAWLRPGLLGITTVDHGIGLWRDGHLLLLGTHEGLPSDNGWTLDPIGAYLYVGSIDGVYRIALSDLPDPAAKPPFHLRAQVVIESSQRASGGRRYGCCNGGGDARSLREGDVLWIASSAGAVRLDTAQLPAPSAPPAARIERASSGDRVYPGDRAIGIDPGHRDLRIDYTGMSLVDSERLEFRYRLQGYDADWSRPSTRRSAYYTHLPPGDYVFHVQARAPFGAWGAEIAPLSMQVLPRWYERRLVQIAAALLALLAIVAAFFRHNAGLRRRARELQQAVDERTAALRDANAKLEVLSRTDSLTGLGNRRVLDAGTDGADRARTGAVLLIDIDHLKRVNDEHGHACGDEVLVALGEILRANTRGSDHVLRWGGEEFLIVSPDIGIDAALALGERIRSAMAAHAFSGHDGGRLQVTCSIGIAGLPVHSGRDGDLDASILLADFALYRAKHAGRDCAYAIELPADFAAGPTRVEMRAEIDRLDELGALTWRERGEITA